MTLLNLKRNLDVDRLLRAIAVGFIAKKVSQLAGNLVSARFLRSRHNMYCRQIDEVFVF
jgi:hypothetical protein